MKIYKLIINWVLFFSSFMVQAQYATIIYADVNITNKTIIISQTITYTNTSKKNLSHLVLNDWNNAYSDKQTPLGKRFSDEYVRSYHYAKLEELGSTNNLIITSNNQNISWCRYENKPDLVKIVLEKELQPNQKISFNLTYQLKIPSDKFTRFGYSNDGQFILKNCFITPARYDDTTGFTQYENLNIDDQTNAIGTIDLIIKTTEDLKITTNLETISSINNEHHFKSDNVLNLDIYIENKNSFSVYKNENQTIISNLQTKKVTDIQKALIIDKVTHFVSDYLGKSNQKKEVVSQNDYDTNSFYGLNQLPAFMSPFPNEFIFELKFLKAFTHNFIKNNLQIDSRKDYWIQDAIEIYLISKYIDQNYPNAKMMGSIAKLKILKGYHLINLDFNEQFNYFYMLTARKNIDQPLGNLKSELLKYNEKIGSKYHAGINLNYLNNYLGNQIIQNSIVEFVEFAKKNQANTKNFKTIIEKKANQNLDWFFNKLIEKNTLIDYKFKDIKTTNNSIQFKLIDKTNSNAPIPVYGFKKNNIVFKQWITNPKDSIYTFDRKNADKLVLNAENLVPEFNLRDNYKSLKKFSLLNKPIKFTLIRDLENPKYNQIICVPEFGYNYYDGIIIGMSFHNKTMLDRNFNWDITPSYSTTSRDLTGSFTFGFKDYDRKNNWFSTRYGLSGNFFHYAPDASYKKINPYLTFRFREENRRDNHFKTLSFREIYVDREPSKLVKNTFEGNYAVFDARFLDSKTEITKHFSYTTDLQIATKLGKIIGEINYRKLFNKNRQLNIRGYFGTFIYKNNTTQYFDFALDRPTDYLFDYNYLGRSESTGLFSQQYITAEGGFKSKLPNQLAGQWLGAINASTNIWNWIEVYTDFGVMKNKKKAERFVYDSGIRLNLVTDYFELYFPIQSTNGFEISQPHYAEKIRFIIAFSPKALTGLVTRKWF